MSTKDKVFVSYSHSFEEKNKLVEEIEAYSKENTSFKIIREIDRVNIRDSFNDYMRALGRGWMVLVILSKEYFQSENCLFELLELDKNKGIDEKRIICIALDDYCCNKAEEITSYIEYWKSKEPVLFDKNKITKEFISKVCQVRTVQYTTGEDTFTPLFDEIDTLVKEQRKIEKEQREGNIRAFRKDCIEEIKKQQKVCPELQKSLESQVAGFRVSLTTLSSSQLKTAFNTLCTATNNALNDAKEERVTQNICHSAMQIVNSLVILSFDDQHFINRPVNFSGEMRLLYHVPFKRRALVEGFMAHEYNVPVRLVKNTGNIVHGEYDLSEVGGLQNGWGYDDIAQKYEDIHKVVGAVGLFERTEHCYKDLSDYIRYLREEQNESYYFSVEKTKGSHGFNQTPKIVDQLQEDIPAIAVTYYGDGVDDVLIMQENDIFFPIHKFFNIIDKYQNHANNQPD